MHRGSSALFRVATEAVYTVPSPSLFPGLRTHIGAHLSSGDHIPHDTLNKLGVRTV